MQSKIRIILQTAAAVIAGGLILMGSAACSQLLTPVTTSAAQATTISQDATSQDATTAPVERTVLLQITETKEGYSIAGKPLPSGNQTKEFTLQADDKIYAGLTDTADDSTRCVLTIIAVTDDGVTVETLENGSTVRRDLTYNKAYEYTAFANPDEYTYTYSVEFNPS